ncbi:MAG: gingipain R, partial [Candidatus Cloacimonetes bacterium]|nr:gingipain R [Candidatus Cloacimonadota bacterium]
MKRTAIFLIVFAVFSLISMSLIALENTIAKPFRIETKSSNSMEIKFRVPEFEIEKELADGRVWDKIKISDSGYLLEIGKPELPIITTTVAIPNHGQVEVEIVNTRTRMIKHIIPYPSQDGTIDGTPKNLSVNQAFYRSSEIYPAEIVRYSDPQIFRDFRIVTIQCQPFAWNAQTQELEVREEIDFRLRFNDEPGINELNEGPLAISPSFAKIYEANILNFDDFRSALVANQPPRYLIIHGNYNDATFQSRINEFSLWKKQKGADVRLVSTAVAGTTTTQIKAFIQNIYNDVNARPDFIIIIGDTNGSFPIPTWPESFSSYSGQGDYPYQHLAGNDYVGDVFIGRISAESNDDLNKLLSKVYFYEKNINVNNAQWLNKMLLVGDTSPSGQSTVYANKYIKELGLIHNPDYIFTELYSDSPSAGDMNNAMNSGVGFFNYRGYIGMSGWSPSSALVNGAKLPHAVIITCSTGNFAGGSSATTEAFTRLGTATVPAGAVTAIGMYTSGTHTMFNNALNMGIFTGIFTHKMRTMGEALLNGKVFLHEVYNQTHSNSVKYFAHWCNLIGDPTMEVFITIPKTFNANIPASLPLGTSNLDLVVTDQNSFPVQNASVTVTQNSIILARGYTDATGAVFLFFNLALTAGPATVVISSHDFKPLVTAIEVNTNGSLVAGTSMIDDDSVGSSIGNGNFSANSGETLEVLFSVRNTTSEIINNVTGSVSTTSPYINILNSNVNFLSVDSGTSNYSIIPVLMQVSPTCPHNTNIKFIMNLTDSADSTYNFPTYLNVTDAFMNFISYQVTDTNNQVLDPNESVHFKVTVKNNGTVPVNNLNAQLITLNDLVLVQDNLGFLGNILVGAQANTAIDDFLIMGRPQLLPGTLIPMRIKLFNDAGFLQWVDFTLTTGVVTSTDPLGPDVYGYVIYDITDTAYEDCPTYSWIGIAPAEGGQGTAITLNDVGVSNDEGDPVGATSMAVVQLPFPFKFYGQTYNQITVSSNGFIVMGVAENANYRNFRLPGTVAGGGGAPSPLIAPFWDDLSTSGGGAFRWYDSINHLFVIEWYQFKNGYVLSAQETFQVILFDPVYYPTSTGDGPIKIQYHTFNNVDTGSTASEWSGRYCTIGIQNYDQTIGLEYSYNNTYPTAAAPLSNQKALFITTAPLYHYTPHLMYDSSFILDNNNNVLEPAETVDLYVNLINLGAQTAQFINTSISSASPYVTIINNTSTYPEIDGDAYEHNITPFRFSVSPNCPDKQILPFTISITTDLNFWQRTFNLIVEKPNIIYHSYLVNDQNGNNNGVTDPGETVALAVMIKNNSLVKANNLTGTLETAFQGVTIGNSTVQVPGLASNDIIQIVFNISLDNSIASNTNIPFNFNMTSTDAPSISK